MPSIVTTALSNVHCHSRGLVLKTAEGGFGDIGLVSQDNLSENLDTVMNTISHVRTSLIRTFDELDTWFDKPEIARSFKPSSDEWSINENLEHITLTSHFLMIVIKNGVAKSLKRATEQRIFPDESDLDFMEAIGIADSFYWHRPEHMIPRGEKPMGEIRTLMRNQKLECLELLDSMPHGEGKLHKVRMSVNQLGKIDMYQWLYFVALHAQRHITQIEQVYAQWQAQN